jgi:hypothetical protein
VLRHYRRYLASGGSSVPVNPHHYVAGLGGSTADIPALVRFAGASSPEGRAAYNALDRLIDAFPRLSMAERRRAEMAIVRGLSRLTRYRENRRRRSFSYSLLARHHAVLARLRAPTLNKILRDLERTRDHQTMRRLRPYLQRARQIARYTGSP